MLITKKIFRLMNICITAAVIAGCGNGKGVPTTNPAIQAFTAIPSIVSPGQSTTLTSDFSGGTGRLDNGVVNRITFGNISTFKAAATTLFTLSVTNKLGQKVSKSVLLTLSPIQGKFSSSISKTVDPRDNYTATFLDPNIVSGPNAGKVLLVGGGTGVALHYRSSAELYDPLLDTFARTGFKTYSTALHGATLLNNGKVLITGGWDGRQAHNDGQLYDPATGSFAFTGAMARARSSHTSTLLPDGTVLITGGYDGAVSLASAELYNPVTGTFTFTNGPMAVARSGHAATLLNNGKVLISGGTPDNTLCEIYDPGTKTFRSTGRMIYARSFHTATLLSSDPVAKVLVAGGSTNTIAELYDPITETFAATDPMTTVRSYHTATLLPDKRVLLTGGSDESAEFYDPNTRTFAETLRDMKEARGSHQAILLHNVPNKYNLPDMVLVVGGTGFINRADLLR